jgi:hypothetical protein
MYSLYTYLKQIISFLPKKILTCPSSRSIQNSFVGKILNHPLYFVGCIVHCNGIFFILTMPPRQVFYVLVPKSKTTGPFIMRSMRLFLCRILVGGLTFGGGCFFSGREMSDAGDAWFAFADFTLSLFVDFLGFADSDFSPTARCHTACFDRIF